MIRFIYWIIAIILLFVIYIIFFVSPFEQKQIEDFLKLMPLFFSALTLIVSLSLYDKFGLKKLIYEKKIKAVLDYVDTMRKFPIKYHVHMPFIGVTMYNSASISISSDMKRIKDSIEPLKDLPIYIYPQNFDEEIMKLYPIITDMYLPIKISKYPFYPYFHKQELELPENYIILTFGDKLFSDFSLGDLYKLNDKEITLGQYIEKNEQLMVEIKNWLKKHTNLHNELKI